MTPNNSTKDDGIIRSVRLTQELSDLIGLDDERGSVADARGQVAHAIGNAFYGIYHIDVETHGFICFREENAQVSESLGFRGTYEEAWSSYLANFVDERDREAMHAFDRLEDLVEALEAKDAVSNEYRRIGVGWTLGTFLACDRDDSGKPAAIVYTARNVSSEHERAEREKADRFAARHDSLSTSLNRRAFDEAVQSGLGAGTNVGLLLLDIDNFKGLNDEFGHDFGDTVISKVGRGLATLFREDDPVFRLGGDEFAVLLRGCDASCWDALRRKLAVLHSDLSVGLPQGATITVSAGVCFGSDGLREWMYKTADQGLYHTKRNGRAGCTLVDERGRVVSSWHDENNSDLTLVALAGTNAGVAKMEFVRDGSVQPRLVMGEALRSLFSIPEEATPEQAFVLWDAGIRDEDREVLLRAADAMIERGNVETSYVWHAPDGDSFRVSLIGSGRVERGVDVYHAIHRSMRGAYLVEGENEAKLIVSAQNSVNLSSAYVSLADDSLKLIKMPGLPDGQTVSIDHAASAIREHAATVAKPAFLPDLEVFLDTSTLQERIGAGGFVDFEADTNTRAGWCRCRWIPARWASDGRLTHALLNIATIDSVKQEQMERERRSAELMQVHFDATEAFSHSRIFGLGLIDRETGESRCWNVMHGRFDRLPLTFDQLNARASESVVGQSPEDFRASLAFPHILDQIRDHGVHTVRARVMHDGEEWHLEYRFTPYPHDPRYVLEAIQDITALHEQEGRSVQDLFDNVPGGLITYEWDGHDLRILHISRYYDELYGSSIAHRGSSGEKGPDFQRVHPDDLADYRKAIAVALAETHEIHYEFRVWSEPRTDWVWCKIDAASRELENGHQLVYAMYSDVTTQKEAQAELVSASRALAERAETLFDADPAMCCVSNFNLTRDVISDTRLATERFAAFDRADGYDESTRAIATMLRKTDADRYLQSFGREALLRAFARGEREVRMEAMFRVEPNLTDWLETAVELTSDPTTGEVEGVRYTRSVGSKRFGELMLNQGLRSDYPMVAVLVGEGDEYYLYDYSRGAFREHLLGFWDVYERGIARVVGHAEARRVCATIDRETVYAKLASGEEPEFAFDVSGEGEARYVLRFSNLDDEKGIVLAALRSVVDKGMFERLHYESLHDSLTGLHNRRGLFQDMRTVLDAHPDERFSVGRLDVQSFRLYNSFFGEGAGDDLLRTIARNLETYCAPFGDRAAFGRVGSDVFALLVPTDQSAYDEGVRTLLEDFANYSDDFHLEPALGVYDVTDHAMPVETMFARAATAAERARKADSGHVALYDQTMEERQLLDMQIQRDMRSGLEQRQFEIHIQPKFRFGTGEPTGGEALVRWRHPDFGLVSPGVFIPVFETNGFVAELDRYMWEGVCAMLREWEDEGLPVRPVSVNVSRVSAYNPQTVPFLKNLVQRYGIEPALLELELTESAYIDDPDRMRRQLKDLQDHGFKIVMDDFGAGYSSLNTLRELPVDIIKLDRGFLTQACADERGRTVLSSMVDLAHRLGLPIVAEGVEDEGQASYLRSIGCEYVQGFLYARPMPAGEYRDFLAHA